MSIKVKDEIVKLTTRQREGRAINAVAELLRQRLSVPNIYIQPSSALIPADVIAVDRGGAGDLHAVEVKLIHHPESEIHLGAGASWSPARRQRAFRERITDVHTQLMSLSAHYRYLAVPAESFDLIAGELASLGSFSDDGIGRLGLIRIEERGVESPHAQLVITPERFRVDSAKLRNLERKLLGKAPDMQVRI